jgi:hypothetical protein
MKRAFLFSAACAAIIGTAWAVGMMFFSDAAVRRGLAIAAVVAFVVQVIAFVVVRTMARRKNVMAGWGIGVAMRFVALFIFALVAVPRLALPLAPSLMGLAIFLFVSTLAEPLFLKS